MKLTVTHNAHLMLQYAAKHTPSREVGGFGRTRVLDSGIIVVDDIIIPPQFVSGGETDISGDTIELVMQMLAQRGESFDDWRLWWHSHGTIPKPFASGTDTKTLEMLAASMGDYFFGVVINSKDEEPYTWLHLIKPKLTCTIPIEFMPYEDDTIKARVDEWMKSVTYRTYPAAVSKAPKANGNQPSGNQYVDHRTGAIARTNGQAALAELEGRYEGRSIMNMTDEEFYEFCNYD